MARSEEEEIRKTLATFFDGLRTLDYDKISETFYGEGLSIGVSRDQGQISHVLRDHWKAMGERERAKGDDFSNATAHWKIRSLNIIGNAASVIIDLAFGIKSEDGETTRKIATIITTTSIIGGIQSQQVYKFILGIDQFKQQRKWPSHVGEPLVGKQLFYNGLTNSFKVVEKIKDPECWTCSYMKKDNRI